LQLAKEQRRVALVQMAICCLSYSKIFNTIIKDLLKEELLEAIKKKHSLLQYADESLQKEIDPTFLYSKSDMTGSELNYDEFSINETLSSALNK